MKTELGIKKSAPGLTAFRGGKESGAFKTDAEGRDSIDKTEHGQDQDISAIDRNAHGLDNKRHEKDTLGVYKNMPGKDGSVVLNKEFVWIHCFLLTYFPASHRNRHGPGTDIQITAML